MITDSSIHKICRRGSSGYWGAKPSLFKSVGLPISVKAPALAPGSSHVKRKENRFSRQPEPEVGLASSLAASEPECPACATAEAPARRA